MKKFIFALLILILPNIGSAQSSDIFTEEWYEKIESPLEFIVFPNPANNTINLRVYRGQSENYSIRISTSLGKILYENSCEREEKIYLPEITNGVYIVEVINDNISKSEILIIKN